ncbi:MAG TPA: sulfite exporter TauE/SafE family protein [Candidatus Hydrogenedens sp.]|nr:sulfite exporter TauE/SafE family protein [Candidatus Hydrogenedens sp.]HOK08708.1 sulfite exporter TauE/SafE family protein [Candidatus Hydrogenedens sp.]HOL18638.1 sulfite exporter TauE/SafE family protein [Candidatus Hydrogenedens sp.]HPP57516.1 sulfite exporter TauE/SafE family protein [Candidatus Hydrogenedens sp.]
MIHIWSQYAIPNIPSVIFWIFVASGVLIQGISKSGFAGGAGIISVPLMMLVMPPDKVTATLLPILILCDLNAIYVHRKNKQWKPILEIYLPAIVGILLGSMMWWYMGKNGIQQFEKPLKQFVGIIAILFALYIWAREFSLKWVEQKSFGIKVGIIAGILAGITSTLAHAAGPIVSLFLFSKNLGKSLFVGTVAWTFTLINLTKLPFYIAVGLVDWSVLTFDIFLIPFVPIGSALGVWLHNKISERTFNFVIMILTIMIGIQLLIGINPIELLVKMLAKTPVSVS